MPSMFFYYKGHWQLYARHSQAQSGTFFINAPLHIMNQIKIHMPLLHDKMHPPPNKKKLVEIQK